MDQSVWEETLSRTELDRTARNNNYNQTYPARWHKEGLKKIKHQNSNTQYSIESFCLFKGIKQLRNICTFMYCIKINSYASCYRSPFVINVFHFMFAAGRNSEVMTMTLLLPSVSCSTLHSTQSSKDTLFRQRLHVTYMVYIFTKKFLW